MIQFESVAVLHGTKKQGDFLTIRAIVIASSARQKNSPPVRQRWSSWTSATVAGSKWRGKTREVLQRCCSYGMTARIWEVYKKMPWSNRVFPSTCESSNTHTHTHTHCCSRFRWHKQENATKTHQPTSIIQQQVQKYRGILYCRTF